MLPIYEIEDRIVRELKVGNRLIVQAPTGSGKSTQVPQMLLKHGFLGEGKVVILQPRRIAARLLATRVAEELRSRLGGLVGYQVRFEDVSSRQTQIKFVTEGILLRQMISDPELRGVSAILFDEFHERHLYGDISLARSLLLQEEARPDLKFIVMSATLDAGHLARYLEPCAVLSSEGRTFPVELDYLPHRVGANGPPVWELAADAFARHAAAGGGGDALVFMPGAYEIQQTMAEIRHRPEAKGYVVLPLHGELAPKDQDAAVARYDGPKVVVATNVAETSITIEGVRLVIDSGLARVGAYDPIRGINTLLIEKISRASADQRTGRAGRTAPGRCVRLWTEREHLERPLQSVPEVKRLDMSEMVLTLKALGVEDLKAFRWVEPPDELGLAYAEILLKDLGALDRGGRITRLGRKMLAFPVHPRYSRMLLAAEERGCVYYAALVAALTQGRDLLVRNAGSEADALRESWAGKKPASDFWVLMKGWEYAAQNQFQLDACRRAGIHAVTARQVGPLFQHFLDIAKREGLEASPRQVPAEQLQKCIIIGFSDRVARRLDQGTLRCELVHGRKGVLARESHVQHAPLFVAAEIREVEGKDRTLNTLLSVATAIEPAWIEELFPEDVESDRQVTFDATQKRVLAEDRRLFRDLPLETKRIEPPPLDAAARILAEEVMAGRLALKEWDHAVEQWILRVNLLGQSCSEFEIVPIGESERFDLIQQICHGAFSYRDIKDRPVKAAVKGWVSDRQQQLVEEHAPERIDLENGKRAKVNYVADGPPYLAVRIQDLYGVTSTPAIAMGRVPVLLHILAPNMRPVQITRDLSGFWKEQYPRVKQELQRKYPKHEWR